MYNNRRGQIGSRVSAAALLAGATVLGCLALGAQAADHGDTAMLTSIGRHDARLSDLHAFVRDGNLVLSVTTDPTACNATTYTFPSDVQFDIYIDNDANVDASKSHPFGGTILDNDIGEDITYRVTFDAAGTPTVNTVGANAPEPEDVFVGLRDDPFLRTPRVGCNIAAIVLGVPLDEVLADQSTLLIWAAAFLDGEQVELLGRGLRNQFGDNPNVPISSNCLNLNQPSDHRVECEQEPDVLIYDTDKQAKTPNGRRLKDDVDQLFKDQPLYKNPGEKTTKTDVPFLDEFPYLGPPHLP